jgi:hypothetical protein
LPILGDENTSLLRRFGSWSQARMDGTPITRQRDIGEPLRPSTSLRCCSERRVSRISSTTRGRTSFASRTVGSRSLVDTLISSSWRNEATARRGCSRVHSRKRCFEGQKVTTVLGGPPSIIFLVHLASDYIHPTPRGGRCRIHLPEDERDAPVVICSELPNNEGSSVTYSAHQIAAEVIRYHKLSVPV